MFSWVLARVSWVLLLLNPTHLVDFRLTGWAICSIEEKKAIIFNSQWKLREERERERTARVRVWSGWESELASPANTQNSDEKITTNSLHLLHHDFLLSLKTKMSITCAFFLQFSKLKKQQQETASREEKKTQQNLPVIEVGFVTRMDVLTVFALMRAKKTDDCSLFIGGF